jgi:hypothetical protein
MLLRIKNIVLCRRSPKEAQLGVTSMQDGKFQPEAKILCNLCHKPLSLTTADTCGDQDGKPVHAGCYSKWLTQKMQKLEPRNMKGESPRFEET